MKVKNMGTVTKCMNPEMGCPNIPDPASAYTVFYKGRALLLCKQCGPEFQRRALLEKQS
jgi:hypothetical protein